MKNMSWDEYYTNFYDWSFSTQRNYSYRLTDFGDPGEVFEVVNALALDDEAFAANFVKRALHAGVRFSPEHVLEMVGMIEESAVSQAAELVGTPFSLDELESLHMMIDDASFERICRKQGMDILQDDESDDWEKPDAMQVKKPGLFASLLAFFTGFGIAAGSGRRHSGRCNGDCANCPPHFGYRYGRWYYGHGHDHGCEFGGNRGGGSD